jgi:hypothetical protein
MFPIQNGLKQGDALSLLCFSFALECAIRKVQENQVRLKVCRTHQILVYVYDINLLGYDIDTLKKNREALIDGSKEVGLEVNTKKAKYMLISRYKNGGQNHVKGSK